MDPKSGGPCQGIRNANPTIVSLGGYREVVSLDDPQSEFLGQDNFPIHALGPEKGPWFYSSHFLPWVEKNISRFDVVIMSGLWLYQSYAIWKVITNLKKRKIPSPKFLVMPHGMLDPYFQRAKTRRLKAVRNWFYWKIIESRVVNDADALLFTCQTELELAREPFRPYHPKQEVNVGYGIKQPPHYLESMKNAFQEKCIGLKEKPYILFLSRIHEKKGVEELIHAYSSFVKQKDNLASFAFVIAGPGLESAFGSKIQQLAREVEDPRFPIYFPGMLNGDAKWGAFYGCDAFILPSHQENFGIAVAEALACGKPVLISNQVNIWKEIADVNGGIVDDDTVLGITRMLSQWVRLSSEDKIHMGENAKKAYERNFAVGPAARNLYYALSSAQSIS